MSAAQGKMIVIDLDGRTARISGKDDLYQGDSYANDIVVEFVRSGAPAQISGYTASGEFERSDGVKVPCTGTLSGNVATIKLDEHCYYRDGVYRLTVRLSKSNEDITRTVLEITGTVQSRSDGPTVDIDETLVNVDKVLELYEEMKDATKNVQSATDAANDAADAAQQATTQANNAANNANVAAGSVNSSINQAASAATNANNAANTANTAAANADMQANSAADAAIRALAAAAKPPLVDPQSKTWRIWDDANQTYKATEYPAQGPKGDKGDKGDAAQVTAENIQTALGYVPADPANVTVSADKIKEALGYIPANEASTEQIFTELDKLENNKLDNRGLPYNRVVATDYQGSIQFLNFTEVGEDVTATKIQQALGYIPLKEITAEGIETALGYEPADKEVTDARLEDRLRLWSNPPNKYVVTDSAGSIRFADPPEGGGSGGGVPPTGPYQMLVTDDEQNQVWEERTHYPYIGRVTILPEVDYSTIDYVENTLSQDIAPYLTGEIVAGKTYYVTFAGEEYECTAFQQDTYTTVLAEGDNFPNGKFYISIYTSGQKWLVVNAVNVSQTTIKVEGPGVKYKKIDPEKYLPEGGVGWTEEGGEVTLWDVTYTEEELTSVLEDGVLTAANPIGLVDGITYKVTWEGTEYESTAVAASPQAGVNIVYVGNRSFLGGNDTGEPFFVCDSPDGSLGIGFMAVIIDPVFPFVAKIVGDGEIVHGIDPKYLPKGGFGYSEEAVTDKALFEGIITQEEWDTSDGGIFKTEEVPALIEGNTYRVLWPDGYHECKAIMVTVPDAGTFPVIGNTSLLGIGEDTGEPFAIAYAHDVEQIASQGIYTIVFLPLPTTETFPLNYVVFGEEKTEIIHTIDKKYLPSSGGSGTKITITKDESGNYTTDTRLVDVYDMTAAELQAAITVHVGRYEMAVYGLSKWLYGGSVPALVFYVTEASDTPTQTTLRMSWMGNEQADMLGPDPNFEEL